MTLQERIDALSALGQSLLQPDELLEAVVLRTYHHNGWFTKENTFQALEAIATHFLDTEALQTWTASYTLGNPQSSRTVGLILAGNIPLVGFHDLLCVFIAGHRAKVKLSDKDKFLLPHLIKMMTAQDERVGAYFEFVDKLEQFDAVIATGSNNSARYFEAYFGKYPHIIRRNRNAVAILDGQESKDQLMALGEDIFQYFGLGCRNVAKIYVPKDYKFDTLLETLHAFNDIVLHNKYKNNFDYNYTLLLLNQVPHYANGCILLTEDEALASRIAQLHYEYYENETDLRAKLEQKQAEIQCIVSSEILEGVATLPFGAAQQPELSDYADGVDTLQFLSDLN